MTPVRLPPRGVFVPRALVYAANLPPNAFQTFVQLLGLAFGKPETPPFSLRELSEITGKSPSTLYKHLAQLSSHGVLRWRTADRGKMIVVFESLKFERSKFPASDDLPPAPAASAQPGVDCSAAAPLPGGAHSDSPGEPPAAARPQRGVCDARGGSLSPANPGSDSEFRESRLPPSSSSYPQEIDALDGEQEEGQNPDSDLSELGNRAPGFGASQSPLEAQAAAIFEALTGRPATATQRAHIARRVGDLDLWRLSLEHWLLHGWSARNLPAMLDFYRRGGPERCRACTGGRAQPAASVTPAAAANPYDALIEEYTRHPPEA